MSKQIQEMSHNDWAVKSLLGFLAVASTEQIYNVAKITLGNISRQAMTNVKGVVDKIKAAIRDMDNDEFRDVLGELDAHGIKIINEMNTFDVKKRHLLTFDQFSKKQELSSDAENMKKGESELVKKSMGGDTSGAKGVATLDDAKKIALGKSREIDKAKGVKTLDDPKKIALGKSTIVAKAKGVDIMDEPDKIKITNESALNESLTWSTDGDAHSAKGKNKYKISKNTSGFVLAVNGKATTRGTLKVCKGAAEDAEKAATKTKKK